MSYKKSKVLAAIMAVMILLNCSAVALAAQHTEYPRGGTWNWGKRDIANTTYAYSEYYLEASKSNDTNGYHKTTVIGDSTDTSDWRPPKTWANSKVKCKWNVTERCYYSVQDYNGNK